MIDRFGQVMLYVENVPECARFWVEKAGFTILGMGDGTAPNEGGIPWAEVAPTERDTSLVLFQKAAIKQQIPDQDFGTPSILFSTYGLAATHEAFTTHGVRVNPIETRNGTRTFSFSDNEGHWFAIREIEGPGA